MVSTAAGSDRREDRSRFVANRMSPADHYREAERLVAEASKPTGLPADVAPDKPAPDYDLLVSQALVHAVLAHAHEPDDRGPWWQRLFRRAG